MRTIRGWRAAAREGTPAEPPPRNPKGRLSAWARAVRLWKQVGKPVRDDAEVTRIYHELCAPCEFFAKGKCRLCGCRLNIGQRAEFNKIRMATENCPAEKW